MDEFTKALSDYVDQIKDRAVRRKMRAEFNLILACEKQDVRMDSMRELCDRVQNILFLKGTNNGDSFKSRSRDAS